MKIMAFNAVAIQRYTEYLAHGANRNSESPEIKADSTTMRLSFAKHDRKAETKVVPGNQQKQIQHP